MTESQPIPRAIRPQREARAMQSARSSSLLPGFVDEARQPVEIRMWNIGVLARQERGDGTLHGIVEEGLQERIDGAAAHLLPRNQRFVDVAGAVAFVAHMAFLLENREMG